MANSPVMRSTHTFSALRSSLLSASMALSILLAAPALAQEPPKADAVVVTVNGKPITEQELTIAEEDLGSSFAGMTAEQRREAIINLLVDIKLGAEAAEKAQIPDTPSFKLLLSFLREKALMQEYMESEGKKAITEDAVKKLYTETIKDLKPEEEVRARHILVPTEEEAKKAVERLEKGEDFAAVAKEMSQDPGSGAQGGDLGFFTKEQMVPEFSETAFKLEAGKVSPPVKSNFGWHIIKVEEKREREIPKLEQVRDQIDLYLTRKAQQDMIKALREKAKIEYTATAQPEKKKQ